MRIKELKTAIWLMRDIAQDFGCELKIKKLKNGASGSFQTFTGILTLDYRIFQMDTEFIWSIFFHELSHAYCRNAGIFNTYHNPFASSFVSHKMFVAVALKAERYVDSLGAGFLQIYFPMLKYVYAYQTMESKKLLREVGDV